MNGRLKPFEPGALALPSLNAWIAQAARDFGLNEEGARAQYERLKADDVWINDEYQVNIDRNPPHSFPDTVLWHLSIKRRNKNPVHDWRDLQAIKNVLVGREYEAIELYPASSRVVDGANQYHLWVFKSIDGVDAPPLPFGWHCPRAVTSDATPNGKQRRLDDDGAAL